MGDCALPRRPAVVLPPLGLGGAPLGNLYGEIPEQEALATVEAAWGAGIRLFDTAPHYGLGLSERRLGRVLARRERTDWILSTKVGRLLRPVQGSPGDRDSEGFHVPATSRRIRDYSRDGVLRSIEESLQRMCLDRVDVVLVHDPEEHVEQTVTEALPALCALRDQGVVRAVGVGMNQSALLARFAAETDIDVVLCAGRYTLLEQPALDDLLPTAAHHGVGVIAGGVFNSGVLAHPDPPARAPYDYAPAPADVLGRARAIAAVCREHGTSLPAAAVHLVLAHPAVVSVVLGMGTPREAVQDAALVAQPPPVALWADLAGRGLLAAGVPVPA